MEVLAAGDTLAAWLQRRPPELDRRAAVEALLDILRSERVGHAGDESGYVRVLSASSVRSLRIPYLFLAGLSEKVFPPADREDRLYSEAEYARLIDAGLPFVARTERTREEMLLFYEAITRAGKRLYLSYPALDESAQPLVAQPVLAGGGTGVRSGANSAHRTGRSPSDSAGRRAGQRGRVPRQGDRHGAGGERGVAGGAVRVAGGEWRVSGEGRQERRDDERRTAVPRSSPPSPLPPSPSSVQPRRRPGVDLPSPGPRPLWARRGRACEATRHTITWRPGSPRSTRLPRPTWSVTPPARSGSSWNGFWRSSPWRTWPWSSTCSIAAG